MNLEILSIMHGRKAMKFGIWVFVSVIGLLIAAGFIFFVCPFMQALSIEEQMANHVVIGLDDSKNKILSISQTGKELVIRCRAVYFNHTDDDWDIRGVNASFMRADGSLFVPQDGTSWSRQDGKAYDLGSQKANSYIAGDFVGFDGRLTYSTILRAQGRTSVVCEFRVPYESNAEPELVIVDIWNMY